LQDRGFAVVSEDSVTLTPVGETLVEAIINTEF
jgi:hypothetical protein